MLKYRPDTCKIYWSTLTDYLHLVTPHPLRSTMCSPPSTHSSILSLCPPSSSPPFLPTPVLIQWRRATKAWPSSWWMKWWSCSSSPKWRPCSRPSSAGRTAPWRTSTRSYGWPIRSCRPSNRVPCYFLFLFLFFLIHVSCFNCQAAKPNLKPARPVCCKRFYSWLPPRIGYQSRQTGSWSAHWSG